MTHAPSDRVSGRPSPERLARACLLLLAAVALAGCDAQLYRLRHEARYYDKPTVAVLSFQAAASSTGWQVGDGLADVLTDELVKTDRFQVVERSNIDAVLGELKMQQGDATRVEGRAKAGRLKNVEYLIKGKITDFGFVARNDGWVRLDWLNVSGERNKAVMRMTFAVVAVESGRIVATRTVEGAVRASQSAGDLSYKKIGFGGGAFYRTPLGRATASATRQAVSEITEVIATQPWQPRIALVQGERIVLNGGTDRGIRAGACYQACEFGEPIVDPASGDVLGRLPGKQVGRIEVTEVFDRYAVAKAALPAAYHVGQHLAPAEVK